jgi:hypothetical protein
MIALLQENKKFKTDDPSGGHMSHDEEGRQSGTDAAQGARASSPVILIASESVYSRSFT